ncbi:hypothetical protein RB608_00320 [Nocardioides sp. LHD-245]|uniref:hypothetical protein n=1 Tax=Nocardioides sp. LHD-245 TaxID=3051387 RepID=UPI0027E0B443|nr:hypothetical protein [Nocardioides sp. LHD-245]
MAARKGKTSTPKVRRPDGEIRDALQRVVRHLEGAASRFDSGDRDEAITMAVLLRSLLHYGSSPPLLHHLGMLKKLEFMDTGPEQEEVGRIVAGGLVLWETTGASDGTSTGRVRAKLDLTSPRRRAYTPWWKSDLVVLDSLGRWHTRRFLVTEMANTDGAHFDPFVREDYYHLTSDNGGWSTIGLDGEAAALSGDLASASIRQIAWEVLQTVPSS